MDLYFLDIFYFNRNIFGIFKLLEFCFFTNGYRIVIMSLLCLLHYAISKVLFDPKVTRAHDVIDQFLLQYFQNVILEIFRIFKNYMKFTKAACWIISNFHYRGNSTTLMIL